MGKLLNRAADRMLARLAPRVTAAASCYYDNLYCYCSRGIAYRHICLICINGSNVDVTCSACQPSGTC